jgi:hypothetical protein
MKKVSTVAAKSSKKISPQKLTVGSGRSQQLVLRVE